MKKKITSRTKLMQGLETKPCAECNELMAKQTPDSICWVCQGLKKKRIRDQVEKEQATRLFAKTIHDRKGQGTWHAK